MQDFFAQSPLGFVVAEQLGRCKLEFDAPEDKWFYEAVREAYRGVGRTYPNPPVGCVIVKDNRIIAKGFTSRAGEGHAEVNALQKAGEEARGATLYSTLEPCNHFGRTPPCTDALIRAGIKRVVIGVKDPNPFVNGNGIRRLREADIEVKLRNPDGLNELAQALMLPFEKSIKKKTPWVTCKVATSLDGRIAQRAGVRTKISHAMAWKLVHRLRNSVDAIVVGSNTVTVDNPQLTVRDLDAQEVKNPIRFVLDGLLRTDTSCAVYDNSAGEACVIHTSLAPHERMQEFDRRSIKRITVESHEGHVSLPHALSAMAHMGITSVFIECGGKLLSEFLRQRLFDELWWLVSPTIFGAEGPSAVSGALHSNAMAGIDWCAPIPVGEDVLFVGRNKE